MRYSRSNITLTFTITASDLNHLVEQSTRLLNFDQLISLYKMHRYRLNTCRPSMYTLCSCVLSYIDC